MATHFSSQKLAATAADLGATQQEIAEYIGITQGTVSKLIGGYITDIGYETGKKLESLVASLKRKAA